MKFLSRSFEKFFNFFGELSMPRKAALVILGVLTIVVIPGMFIFASQSTYTPVATNLSTEDSTAIIRYLREKKIPFVVDESGKAISVPPEKVYDLRLELYSKGLAQTGVVGYEVFDKQSFGVTSTVQRINEQRALEGELVRTINHIRGIERSRVHLAIPAKSVFLEQERKPTASVILDLESGSNPSEDQIRGIQHMVAAAVKGLDVEDVTIISDTGKQLSQNNSDPAAIFAAASLDYQRKFEKKTESKIEELLSRIVGDGKVVARVNADFDFRKISETQTLFDGDNATPRSVTKDTDVMQGSRPLAAGAPGVKSQVPGADGNAVGTGAVAAAPAPAITNSTQRSRETSNMEVPKTVRSTEKPMADLRRLSVAVMVDGNQVPDEKVPGGFKYEPLPEEKLAQMKSVIANAVGWDERRDPPIEVKNMPFYKEDVVAATNAANSVERNRLIGRLIQWAVIGLLFTLFFIYVVHPFIKWLTENTMDSVDDLLPRTLEELERAQSRQIIPGMDEVLPEISEKVDPEKVQSEMIKEKIVSIINDNPQKASRILHEWLHPKSEENAKKGAAAANG